MVHKNFSYTLFIATIISGLLLSVFQRAEPSELTLNETNSIEQKYFSAIDTVDESVFKREYEYPFLEVLNPNQFDHYRKLESLVSRKFFLKYYWKQMNPNPILPQNEWLQTFLARWSYVKQHFSISEPPYFDERGKYYLKYGPPEMRYQQHEQRKRVALFTDRELHNFIDSSQAYTAFHYIPEYYHVRSNESWVYNFPGEFNSEKVCIHFVDEGRAFREVKSMADFIYGFERPSYRIWYWCDLIKERANALQIKMLLDMAFDIFQMENDVRAAYESTLSAMTPKNNLPYQTDSPEGIFRLKSQNPFQDLQSRINQYEGAMSALKADVPVATFEPDQAANRITFTHRIAQFQGENGATLLAITLLSPIRENYMADSTDTVSDLIQLEYTCLLRDHFLNPVVADQINADFPLQRALQAQIPNVIGFLNMQVQPRKGELTVQITDKTFEKIGFKREDFEIRDFTSTNLMLSDIQLLAEITDNTPGEILPQIEVEHIQMGLYPFHQIRKKVPLFTYLEIYNLQTAGLQDEYKIAFEVTRQEEAKNMFKKLSNLISPPKEIAIKIEHTRSITSDIARELITLDFARLQPGPYQLKITVSDPANANQSASVQQAIFIAPD